METDAEASGREDAQAKKSSGKKAPPVPPVQVRGKGKYRDKKLLIPSTPRYVSLCTASLTRALVPTDARVCLL
jgi:hypothetical protein